MILGGADHLTVLAIVPRGGYAIRVLVVAGLLAPWLWLVAIDRLLSHKR